MFKTFKRTNQQEGDTTFQESTSQKEVNKEAIDKTKEKMWEFLRKIAENQQDTVRMLLSLLNNLNTNMEGEILFFMRDEGEDRQDNLKKLEEIRKSLYGVENMVREDNMACSKFKAWVANMKSIDDLELRVQSEPHFTIQSKINKDNHRIYTDEDIDEVDGMEKKEKNEKKITKTT